MTAASDRGEGEGVGGGCDLTELTSVGLMSCGKGGDGEGNGVGGEAVNTSDRSGGEGVGSGRSGGCAGGESGGTRAGGLHGVMCVHLRGRGGMSRKEGGVGAVWTSCGGDGDGKGDVSGGSGGGKWVGARCGGGGAIGGSSGVERGGSNAVSTMQRR